MYCWLVMVWTYGNRGNSGEEDKNQISNHPLSFPSLTSNDPNAPSHSSFVLTRDSNAVLLSSINSILPLISTQKKKIKNH